MNSLFFFACAMWFVAVLVRAGRTEGYQILFSEGRYTIKKQTKQMFIEDEGGSICEGKYADFLIVDKDLLSCPEDVIHTAKPLATYFEEKKVFSA